MNYLDNLSKAHEIMLSKILTGRKFNKMMQQPLHSKDMQYGVPLEFNIILDSLLDPKHAEPAEQTMKSQESDSSEGNNKSKHHDCRDEDDLVFDNQRNEEPHTDPPADIENEDWGIS